MRVQVLVRSGVLVPVPPGQRRLRPSPGRPPNQCELMTPQGGGAPLNQPQLVLVQVTQNPTRCECGQPLNDL